MITRQVAIRLAGLALVAGLAAGCGSTTATAKPATPAAPPASSSAPATPAAPPSTPLPFNMPIGEPVHMTDDSNGSAWDVTLNSVHHFTQGQYDNPAPAGTHYIVVNVTYDVTTGPVDINEWDWTAKDASGTTSGVQIVTGGPNDLSANTIQSGSKTRGTVVLAVTNDSGGTVVYSAGSSEQASWKFTAAQAAS